MSVRTIILPTGEHAWHGPGAIAERMGISERTFWGDVSIGVYTPRRIGKKRVPYATEKEIDEFRQARQMCFGTRCRDSAKMVQSL